MAAVWPWLYGFNIAAGKLNSTLLLHSKAKLDLGLCTNSIYGKESDMLLRPWHPRWRTCDVMYKWSPLTARRVQNYWCFYSQCSILSPLQICNKLISRPSTVKNMKVRDTCQNLWCLGKRVVRILWCADLNALAEARSGPRHDLLKAMAGPWCLDVSSYRCFRNKNVSVFYIR